MTDSLKKIAKADRSTVLCGMSGGVDSSVAAALLLKDNYSVAGATMRLYDGEFNGGADSKKPSDDIKDAQNVCERLGIKHYILDFKEQFEKMVIDRFYSKYAAGLTPNPCVDCNRYIKFGEMLNRAESLGFDFIATGHYAVVEKYGDRYLLKKAKDKSKDQTYVLYSLTQKELSHLLLPLGGLSKQQVREIANELLFYNARKPDSQDICFVPDGKYADFLTRRGGCFPPGDFVDKQGEIIGKHEGIIRYTVGQRKGLGQTFGKPMYVLSKNADENTVTLGDNEDLFKNRVYVRNVNFSAFSDLNGSLSVTAKLRYSAAEAQALLTPGDDGEYVLEFKQPQRAVTPGQSAVFYDGDICLGGGEIVG